MTAADTGMARNGAAISSAQQMTRQPPSSRASRPPLRVSKRGQQHGQQQQEIGGLGTAGALGRSKDQHRNHTRRHGKPEGWRRALARP